MTSKNEMGLEITVISAETLKTSSYFPLSSSKLRPYVALVSACSGGTDQKLHRTCIADDDTRYSNSGPVWKWNRTFRLPVDPTSFLYRGVLGLDAAASVHVSVLSKGKGFSLLGPTELGWCLVRPSDVVDGVRPPGMPRRISYALRRGRDGDRSPGVLHLSVRLVGPALMLPPPLPPLARHGWGQVAIGIPVGPAFGPQRRSDCDWGAGEGESRSRRF